MDDDGTAVHTTHSHGLGRLMILTVIFFARWWSLWPSEWGIHDADSSAACTDAVIGNA